MSPRAGAIMTVVTGSLSGRICIWLSSATSMLLFPCGHILLIIALYNPVQVSSVQSLSLVQIFSTPWTAACLSSLSITSSQSLLKNSCPLSQWCHPTTWPSSCPSPAAFHLSRHQVSQMSQFFVSGAQSIRVSASVSVLPKPCRKSPSGKQLFFVLILIHSCFGKVIFVTQILRSECLGSHSVMSDSLWPHGL